MSFTMVFKSRHGLIFYPPIEEQRNVGCGEEKRRGSVEDGGGEKRESGREKRDGVSLSEGMPLQTHRNKEERRVCVCVFLCMQHIVCSY